MGDEAATDTTEPTPELDTETIEKTFTQKDVTRIGAKEKAEGTRAGLRRALEAAGVESLEDLVALRAGLDKAENEKLDEAARLRKELEAERAAAAAERRAAAADRFDAKLERKLLQQGVGPEVVAKVSKLVGADVDSSDEDIDTAIADLMESLPQLFGPGDSGTAESGPPTSDPGKSPTGVNKTSSPTDRAQARLQQRHGRKLSHKNP